MSNIDNTKRCTLQYDTTVQSNTMHITYTAANINLNTLIRVETIKVSNTILFSKRAQVDFL